MSFTSVRVYVDRPVEVLVGEQQRMGDERRLDRQSSEMPASERKSIHFLMLLEKRGK